MRQGLGVVRTGRGWPGWAIAAAGLALNVAPNTDLIAVLDETETAFPDGRVWLGHVEGEPLSSVVLVFQAGVLAGQPTTLDAQ